MRHTTRELADGFHLLGLAELLFQLAAFGDIAGVGHNEPLQRLLRNAPANGLQRSPLPVLTALAVFHADLFSGIGHCLLDRGGHLRYVVTMDEFNCAVTY